MQVGQFEGIVQHCLATPGVHVIDLPINYAVSAQLQVCVMPQCLSNGAKAPSGVFSWVTAQMRFWSAPLMIDSAQQIAGQEQGGRSVQRSYAALGGSTEPLDPCSHPWLSRYLLLVGRSQR